MKFDPVLLAPRMAPMKAAGLWRDETIDVHVQRALRNCPDKLAVVAYAAERSEPVRLTYRELDVQVDLVARGLASLGVGRQQPQEGRLAERSGLGR